MTRFSDSFELYLRRALSCSSDLLRSSLNFLLNFFSRSSKGIWSLDYFFLYLLAGWASTNGNGSSPSLSRFCLVVFLGDDSTEEKSALTSWVIILFFAVDSLAYLSPASDMWPKLFLLLWTKEVRCGRFWAWSIEIEFLLMLLGPPCPYQGPWPLNYLYD